MLLRDRLAAVLRRLRRSDERRPWHLVAEARVLLFLLAFYGERAPVRDAWPPMPTSLPPPDAPPFPPDPARPSHDRTAILHRLHEVNEASRRDEAARRREEAERRERFRFGFSDAPTPPPTLAEDLGWLAAFAHALTLLLIFGSLVVRKTDAGVAAEFFWAAAFVGTVGFAATIWCVLEWRREKLGGRRTRPARRALRQ